MNLLHRKLESGSNDSGCVPRIKLCSIPEIFLNKICVGTKLELNFVFLPNFQL